MSYKSVEWIIATSSPSDLADFYSRAIEGGVISEGSDNHYWIFHPDGMKINFYKPSRSRSWPAKGRSTSLCIKHEPAEDPLSVIEEWSLKLRDKGALILEKPMLEAFGAESWMEDPEGNCFLILVPSL